MYRRHVRHMRETMCVCVCVCVCHMQNLNTTGYGGALLAINVSRPILVQGCTFFNITSGVSVTCVCDTCDLCEKSVWDMCEV